MSRFVSGREPGNFENRMPSNSQGGRCEFAQTKTKICVEFDGILEWAERPLFDSEILRVFILKAWKRGLLPFVSLSFVFMLPHVRYIQWFLLWLRMWLMGAVNCAKTSRVRQWACVIPASDTKEQNYALVWPSKHADRVLTCRQFGRVRGRWLLCWSSYELKK